MTCAVLIVVAMLFFLEVLAAKFRCLRDFTPADWLWWLHSHSTLITASKQPGM